jgi:hypothetical protein
LEVAAPPHVSTVCAKHVRLSVAQLLMVWSGAAKDLAKILVDRLVIVDDEQAPIPVGHRFFLEKHPTGAIVEMAAGTMPNAGHDPRRK